MENAKAKTITLALSAVMAVLLFAEAHPICKGEPFANRFLYHFFHASAIHYLTNAWCLVSVVFAFDLALSDLAVAYIIASFVPVIWTTPTIGLSGVCFTLLGRCSFLVRRKMHYHYFMALFIIAGLVMPNVNGFIHLYCYVAGILYGLLIHPIKWQKKR